MLSAKARRVLKVLQERSLRGRSCVTLAVIAADARLSLSEAREAADELERAGIALVSGDKVCYVGFEASQELPSRGPALDAILSLAKRRSIIVAVTDVSKSIPYVDYVVARRDGIIFLIHIVRRGESGERLEAVARKLARQARRLAEGRVELDLPREPTIIIPLLAGDYGAPRLVEGVAYRPASKLAEAVLTPETITAIPAARYYRFRGQSAEST